MTRTLITEPGAYENIDAEDYHRRADLLPSPSLSSSGAKTIIGKSPFHFWFDSPLNPERPPEDDKPHLVIGKAAHDMLLLEDRWPDHYHVLPDGFNAGHTNKWGDAIVEAEAARKAGKTIMRASDRNVVLTVASAIRRNDLACSVLSNGRPEVTLAWQDDRTGVWLRARPDWLPNSVIDGGKTVILSDLKFMTPTHCDPAGFSRAIASFGYHQSLAFYADGIKAIYGRAPTHYLLVVVEKDAPWSVSLYEVDPNDIERGRFQNRRAIAIFADCLQSGKWPGYADQPERVGLPQWSRKMIDEGAPSPVDVAWGDAL